MSPVDHEHGRHGRHGRLAPEQYEWTCPGCGAKYVGQAEDGCPECKTGKFQVVPAPPPAKAAAPALPRVPSAPISPQGRTLRVATSTAGVEPAPAATSVRVYRLIEYEFQQDMPVFVEEVLRQSLIGRIPLGGLAITGCIVDDLSELQRDRLRLAKLQPGVWTGKQIADEGKPNLAEILYQQAKKHEAAKRESEERLMTPIILEPPPPSKPLQPEYQQLADLPEKLLRSIGWAFRVAVAQFPEQEDDYYLGQHQLEAIADWVAEQIPMNEADFNAGAGDGSDEARPALTDEEKQRRADIAATLGQEPTAVFDETKASGDPAAEYLKLQEQRRGR